MDAEPVGKMGTDDAGDNAGDTVERMKQLVGEINCNRITQMG